MGSADFPHFLRPTWMEVDLDRLAHNVGQVRRVVGPGRRLIAVAKGDAYGHGSEHTVPTMIEAGADMVALGNLSEAVRLRENNFDAPILLFGSCLPSDSAEVVTRYKVTPTVWDVEGARAYSRAAREPLAVYLKVDTGLSRLGVLAEEAAEVARGIEDLPNLHIEGVYTHFADPIQGEEFTAVQFRRFTAAVKAIRAAGVIPLYTCVASTAVVSMHPEMYLNAVDPGRLIYGFYYPETPPVSLDLMPVVRGVKSRIIQAKWIEAGETIGYARTFRPVRRTLVGVLPLGWRDGLNRRIANRAQVLVKGKRCTLIGALNFEHCLVDLTELGAVHTGEEAVFIGEQGDEQITAGEQARCAGVPEFELIALLGRTINRAYLMGGRVIAVQER